MNCRTAQNTTTALLLHNALLLQYSYAKGLAETLPKHSHEEYQIYVDNGLPRELYYRGTSYSVPARSFTVINPGEIHAVRDLENRQVPVQLQLIFVPQITMNAIAEEVLGRKTVSPFFPEPIVRDSSLMQLVLNCFLAPEQGGVSRLEQESLLVSLLTQLVSQHAVFSNLSPLGSERKDVQQVQDYLRANYAKKVSIMELAQVAHLSPYHLNRVFCAEVGIPPHQYQTQIRVAHAKTLLAQGMSTSEVAARTGFADQSHLTRYFKRFMQVTPGRYRPQDSKNVQEKVS